MMLSQGVRYIMCDRVTFAMIPNGWTPKRKKIIMGKIEIP